MQKPTINSMIYGVGAKRGIFNLNKHAQATHDNRVNSLDNLTPCYYTR